MNNERKEKILKEHEGTMRYHVNNFYISDLDHEDMMQEVRMHVAKKLDEYDPKRSSMATYISRISRNKLRNLAKSPKNKKEPVVDIEVVDLMQDDAVKGDIDRYVAREVAGILKDFPRKDIIGMIVGGMSQSDTARVMGVSRQYVSRIWKEFQEFCKKRLTY